MGHDLVIDERRHLGGDIVLADSQIRYHNPVTENPIALTSLDGISGDLDRLASGRKARIVIHVRIQSGDIDAVEFIGTYMLYLIIKRHSVITADASNILLLFSLQISLMTLILPTRSDHSSKQG